MNNKDLFSIIREFTEAFGPVGRETYIQELIEKKWDYYGVKTCYDKIGNLFGRIEGSGPHWAIVSHSDSIGFIVQSILSNGFLKVAFNTAATFPDARFLAGTCLKFLTKSKSFVEGYFGLRSGHIAGIKGKKQAVVFDDLYVDLGVNSKEEVLQLGIDIGTPAVFAQKTSQIQENIVGPSFDNRVGSVVQYLLLQELKAKNIAPNLTMISTIQEEIGLKGAAAAANSGDYDGVIVLDVGLVGDTPCTKNDFIPTKLGEGPIIVYKDFSVHYSIDLIKKVEKVAHERKIKIQKAVFKNFRTDGEYFFMQGHPTCMLAIPCRYTHTHFETVRLSDIVSTVELLLNLITT
ncbi:MAG: M42 family metallopeptidase [Candidatus Hodarchaeales archaeon]